MNRSKISLMIKIAVFFTLSISTQSLFSQELDLTEVKKIIAVQQKMISDQTALIESQSQKINQLIKWQETREKNHISGSMTADGGYRIGDKVVIDADARWHRSYGDTGWYNGTHDGGWHMKDKTWVRSYKGKNVYTEGLIRGDEGFEVDNKTVIDDNAGWHRTYGNTGWYNQTHDGGWHMKDQNWVRSYKGKGVLTEGYMQANRGFKVGNKLIVDSKGNIRIRVAIEEPDSVFGCFPYGVGYQRKCLTLKSF